MYSPPVATRDINNICIVFTIILAWFLDWKYIVIVVLKVVLKYSKQ